MYKFKGSSGFKEGPKRSNVFDKTQNFKDFTQKYNQKAQSCPKSKSILQVNQNYQIQFSTPLQMTKKQKLNSQKYQTKLKG